MPDKELIKDLHFPRGGINNSQAYSRQPNVPITLNQTPAPAPQPGITTTTTPLNSPQSEVDYVRTTPVALNVRGFEPTTNRMRGGSRCGLSKFINAKVSGSTFIIQDLAQLIINATKTPQGNMPQPSNQGRVITILAVVQGNIYSAATGDTAWTVAANGTPRVTPLNYSGIVSSAANIQNMYYVDGINYVVYSPKTNTANVWSAGTTDLNGNPIAGSLPFDTAKNTARLICTWRGRTCLSGLLLEGNNIFMSAVGDPNNWDYSPESTTPTQAVNLETSPLGAVGNIVTTMIPYTDDVMVIGTNSSIWLLNGDPMAGGQLDLVSETIGMAWNIPWAKDPVGTIYFMSNTGGIWTLIPGQAPVRISQPIEQLIDGVDTGLNSIRLLWSDRYQGVHFWITNLVSQQVNMHLFYEARTSAWYQDVYANTDLDPICCVTADGNVGEDRVPLQGSWSGYVYAVDPQSTTDDGTAFTSQVLIGPLLSPVTDSMLVKDLQAIMGETSGQVNYQVYVGETAEAALSSVPVATGVWNSGRNFNIPIRQSGHAVYIGITSTNSWAMEEIKVRLATQGAVRRRSYR